jgi:transposase-like protein
VYPALAVLPDGSRDIPGVWLEQTERAKFWLKRTRVTTTSSL